MMEFALDLDDHFLLAIDEVHATNPLVTAEVDLTLHASMPSLGE